MSVCDTGANESKHKSRMHRQLSRRTSSHERCTIFAKHSIQLRAWRWTNAHRSRADTSSETSRGKPFDGSREQTKRYSSNAELRSVKSAFYSSESNRSILRVNDALELHNARQFARAADLGEGRRNVLDTSLFHASRARRRGAGTSQSANLHIEVSKVTCTIVSGISQYVLKSAVLRCLPIQKV